MTAAPVLAARGLTKRFGGLTATDAVDLDVGPGEVHAVIGPNGAGKTTLIGQLTGAVRSQAGRVRLDGRDVTALGPARRSRLGLARSFQITNVFAGFSALENAAIAAQARAGHSFRFWRRADREADLNARAAAALARVGLGDLADRPAGTLAHGQKRQLEIAMALAQDPRVLLLDEPMAGTGPDEAAAMVALMATLKGQIAMLLVEHDMDAVFALADRVTVLVEGRVVATGSPAAVRRDPAVRTAYLGAEDGADGGDGGP